MTELIAFQTNDTLELECYLPPSYPSERLSFMLRSSTLSNAALRRVTSDLHDFLDAEVPAGDLCVTSLIGWLQENAEKIYAAEFATGGQCEVTKRQNKEAFNRLWIYSHHIYR